MNSSQNILIAIYKDSRTVFKISDIAQLSGLTNPGLLARRMNYYVKQGQILNLHKGIYAKENYRMEELAACLYTPSYISLDYVLQRKGVVFQYNSQITMISYLSRSVQIEQNEIRYRKIKGEILVNLIGIEYKEGLYIATPERAFLDLFYLVPDFYFDNLAVLNKKKIKEILPIYSSKALTQRTYKLLAL